MSHLALYLYHYALLSRQVTTSHLQAAVGNDEPELEFEDEAQQPPRVYSRLKRARAAQRPPIVDDHEDDTTDRDYYPPSKRGRGGEA